MHASAGWYGDHTVDATSDGVTVRKGLDLDTLALPALKFEIRSEREAPVGVRVVDRLPAAVDPNRVGVHADFAADQWTAFEDGRVTFTTRLDPDRPVVTLYGIWMDDPSRVHELLGSPDVNVVDDPGAPSLDPVGDEARLPTVDDSLRSVGPDALADLRADVEAALTGARVEPAEPATALPAPGADEDDGDDDPEGTMGDHAWAYPVERRGTGRIAAPTHADLDDLVDGDVGEDHVYLRAALAETHHGGGGALLLQELANAFQVVARRVTGDAERATVDAVVKTPLGSEPVLRALADRDQVTDSLVSPLVGDPDDATGIDAEPDGDTEVAAREGSAELSIEPDDEDVEVVLNADGERFSELKAEFDVETDTDALEDELADLDLPGVNTSEEPSIDDLVDGGDDFDAGGDGRFVPASVEDEETLSFDGDPADATELDFSPDSEAVDAEATGEDAVDGDVTEDDASEDDAFQLGAVADAETPAFDASEDGTGDGDAPSTPADMGDAASDPADSGDGDAASDPADPPFEFASERGDGRSDIDVEPWTEDEETAVSDDDGVQGVAAGDGEVAEPVAGDGEVAEPVAGEDGLGEPTTADHSAEVKVVAVPARELAAIRTEMRELRDRVATLESDLAAVRADLARERGAESGQAARDGRDSLEAVDGVDDGD